MTSSDRLGTEKVQRLIFSMGWPAALNFLVATIYNITDVIFVGHWLGQMPIAAVVIVGMISFLFSSFGLAIGVGGASIISRALGEKDDEKASRVLGNLLILVLILSSTMVITGLVFEGSILRTFGANGGIFVYASAYYRVILFGTPFCSLSMMANSVIQAEGKAKTAMFISLASTGINILLNPLFIGGFGMGITGSAWATMSGYILNALLVLFFFVGRMGEIRISYRSFKIDIALIREILGIGGILFINIIGTNLFFVLLNKRLFKFQQESGVIIYSIVSRVWLSFMIPIVGLEGGIRPVIGYNFGSQQIDRIKVAVHSAIRYGILISTVLLAIVFSGGDYLIRLFTNDPHIGSAGLSAMKIVLSFFPLFIMEVVAIAYFQSIGKPRVALYLILLRYVVLPIPLLYILSYFFDYQGVLYVFPAVDFLTAIPAFFFLRSELNFRLHKRLFIN
jgi:MATE family, multidrug efflux pump